MSTFIFITRNALNYLTVFSDILIVLLLIAVIHLKLLKKPAGLRRFCAWLLDFCQKNSLLLALIVSLTATLGSLFFSEIMGYEPCKLCWFQRIFMYPLPILFIVGLLRKESIISFYALPLSMIGGLIALYHYFLQIGKLWEIAVDKFAPCSAVGYSASCTASFFLSFGYITIPMMSFSAFTLIVLILILLKKNNQF